MEFCGIVRRIVFRNPDNGYVVLTCEDADKPRFVTVVGLLNDVRVGQKFRFGGEYTAHKKYGQQFSFQTYTEELPQTKKGIVNYLGSGLIKGVGPKLAESIYDTFGDKTLDILNNNPENLQKVPGIGKKKLEKICDSWKEHKGISDIMIFLRGCDITPTISAKIYRTYRENSINIVKTNPYQLIKDIEGIAFKIADSIAMKMGITVDDPRRLRAAVTFLLEKQSTEGHCYSSQEDIINLARRNLNIDTLKMQIAISDAVKNRDIIFENNVFWLPNLLRDEKMVAKNLNEIQKTKGIEIDENIVNSILQKSDMEYSESQIKAIKEVAQNKVFVLTGGPGTGKSTVSKAILDMFEAAGIKCLLASPTGRAAKRLQEATGRDAKTIHRLLDYNPSLGFQCNASNPLYCDAVLIDEASMVDISLMYHLLEAIPKEAYLVLVGDADQLPSVGPGNVLRDIIESGKIAVRKLDVIFRQKQGSQIIDVADKVNTGQYITPSRFFNNEFMYVDNFDTEAIKNMVIKRINQLKNQGVSLNDIQVLCPQKKTENIGTIAMNLCMQEEYNPNGSPVEETNFRIGDKVMQIKNNYDKNVFNGDIGFIVNYDKFEKEFTVKFDDSFVTYDILEKDQLSLAYACTIHKSQGSEYPYVIMPFVITAPLLRCRNILYTGITRTKKGLTLIGNHNDINKSISNNYIAPRRTLLKVRLVQLQYIPPQF